MVMNRSDLAIWPRIARMEAAMPFVIVGINHDNGGEFVNYTLLRYWREREHPVVVTRSLLAWRTGLSKLGSVRPRGESVTKVKRSENLRAGGACVWEPCAFSRLPGRFGARKARA